MGTQSARILRSYRRAIGRAIGLVASVFILTFLSLVSSAAAQEGGNQVGLVIQFGDGSLHTTCVELGPSGQATGEEVLRAAGFATVIDYGSGFGGGTVCKIGNEGCDFPAEKCFCQCTMKPGDPCIYWSYFHLVDGQWRYSVHGASSYRVSPGDVEAWVWGVGSARTGAAPPHITFEQICGVSSEVTRKTATGEPPLSSGTPVPRTPVVAAQSGETATGTPTPSPVPPATPTLAPAPATQTPTPGVVASSADGKPLTPAENQEAAAASSNPNADGVSGSVIGYIVFGFLAAALVGGLIFLRVR